MEQPYPESGAIPAAKPPPGLLKRIREALSWQRLWWGSGLFFITGTALFTAGDGETCLGVLFVFLLVLWSLPTLGWLLWWTWRKLTYRISVRLFISYLLIGVMPFPLLLVVFGFGGYILLGQYTSAEFGDVSERLRDELIRFSRESLEAASTGGAAAALGVLRAGPDLPPSIAAVGERVEWILAVDGETWASDGAADLAVPDWLEDGTIASPFLDGDRVMMATLARSGATIVAALVHLNPETARVLSRDEWYEIQFLRDVDPDDDNLNFQRVDDDVEDAETRDSSDQDADTQDTGDQDADVEDPADPGTSAQDSDLGETLSPRGDQGGETLWDTLWKKRWIFFLRVGSELRRWRNGEVVAGSESAILVRTSPREIAEDLFVVPTEMADALWGTFAAVALSFFFLYLAVVSLAIFQIWVITRSTARLTRGTRQVQAGNLDYRIPIKRRDQLGDLALAFNNMTGSVRGMLDEVAEKERLKGELELAREIQQSLLPGRHLEHGSVTVHAYFRPAAEVGGDYFDLFPLDGGRLIVAAGDVAGHGLSTGLLMAMVKSAVATLITEGHRGSDLLERVNQFMLQQPREHRMVTLAIADIDPERGVATITNAAHPPVYLSGGEVTEVMLPALPVGYKWRQPPPTRELELEPGSRLVFYSDGLVEAVDKNGDQFGYEHLKALLEEHAELPSKALLDRILKELEAHTEDRPLDDDLTVLVIDCGG